MSDLYGNAFLNPVIGPGIIWIVMLAFFLLLLLSVWQKGLITGLSSSRTTEPEEEKRETKFEYNVPQYLEQVALVMIEAEE